MECHAARMLPLSCRPMGPSRSLTLSAMSALEQWAGLLSRKSVSVAVQVLGRLNDDPIHWR